MKCTFSGCKTDGPSLYHVELIDNVAMTTVSAHLCRECHKHLVWDSRLQVITLEKRNDGESPWIPFSMAMIKRSKIASCCCN